MTQLSQAEAFARIRLLRSPRIGPVTFAQLLARYGTGEAAVEALSNLAMAGGGHHQHLASSNLSPNPILPGFRRGPRGVSWLSGA